MDDGTDSSRVSRRTLLRASAGTVTLSAVGAGTANAAGPAESRSWFDRRCPDATLEPSMGHCEGASMDGCEDDHPATVALREAVQEALEERYPDAGTLVEEGYKPYFDTLDRDADGWSHWINPDYVGDDAIMDPERPESVLVDNDTWRSIGVMFIATRDGEPVDPPPAVYDEGDDDGTGPIDGRDESDMGHEDGHGEDHDGHGDDHGNHDEHGDHGEHGDHDGHDGHDHANHGDDDRCSPWHYHAGLPGRFAWWYYRQAYEQDFADGDLELPCRTPCMMHVWAVDHPEGVYAHGGPPPEYRDQEAADEAGFDTDAEPGSDELDWEALPDDLVPALLPDDFTALIPGL